MNNKIIKLAALFAAATLTLAACGDDGGASSSGSDHNDQDVAFASDMIPHHAQAVQMAQMAEDRADNPQVQELASQIEAAQGPEIDTMAGWLEDWNEDVPPTDMGDMGGTNDNDMDHDMGDMGGTDMPGMMSETAMDELGGSTGADFDSMFLRMMIEHHEGAIEMARTEQQEGKNPDAIQLAKDIEAAQTDEIATMEDLLTS